MPSNPSMQLELRSAYVPGEDKERLSLSALNADETHVHGELAWTIGERRVPFMGYFGPDDVCLGDWWDGLTAALAALSEGKPYTFDSCEQGEPAFLFERRDASVHVSFVAGMGGGGPQSDWQNVELAFDELRAAVLRFKRDLRHLLESEGPAEVPEDWKRRLSELA